MPREVLNENKDQELEKARTGPTRGLLLFGRAGSEGYTGLYSVSLILLLLSL